MLATAADELKFSKWPQEDPTDVHTLGVISQIISFCWSPDNRYAIFLEDGGNPVIISVKDMDSIKLVHTISSVNDATSVVFQKTSKRRVAITRISLNIALYDTKKKELEKMISVPQPAVSIDFSANDRYLIVACHDGNVLLLNFPDGTVLSNFTVYAVPSSISFHPQDEELFAVGTKEGSVFAYETDNQEPIYYTMLHETAVFSVKYSTNSKDTLISASSKKFCVHNIQSRRCVYKGELPCSITCIDFTSDGEHFALSTEDGMVRTYKTDAYEVPLSSWKAHSGKITILKFAADYKITTDSSSETIELSSSSSLDPIPSPRDRILDDGGLTLFYDKYVKNAAKDKTLKNMKKELVEKVYDITRTIRLRFAAKMDIITKYINHEFIQMQIQDSDKWEFLNGVLTNAETKAETVKSKKSEPKMPAPTETVVTAGTSRSYKSPEGSVKTARSQRLVRLEPNMSDISEKTEWSECSSRTAWSESPVRSVRSLVSEKSKESVKTKKSEKPEGSMRTDKSERRSKCTAYYSNELE